MAKYLLLTTFEPGVVDSPMEEWTPEEITAHLDYYRALNTRLAESGELVDVTILTPPDAARVVRSDGTAPVVTDGPFQEFKEWVAGFQVLDVDSEERALEIAELFSAVRSRLSARPPRPPARSPSRRRRTGRRPSPDARGWAAGAAPHPARARPRRARRSRAPDPRSRRR